MGSKRAVRFSASRFTSGNFLFPDRLKLSSEGVVFEKRYLIGGEEETIQYEQIASVSVQRGVFFGDLLIETTGGSEPVFLNGLWLGAAERAKREIGAHLRFKQRSEEERVLAALAEQTQLLREILGELRSGRS